MQSWLTMCWFVGGDNLNWALQCFIAPAVAIRSITLSSDKNPEWDILVKLIWVVLEIAIKQLFWLLTYLNKHKKLVPWGTDGRLPLSDLDLDLGSGHTAYRRAYHSSTSTYTYQISLRSEENFFRRSPLRFWSSSESRDTKTRTNIKNPARSNLDIVL